MNWRATVRRPAEVTGRYSYFGPTIKSGFNPISEREMYIYLLQNVPERPRWEDEELPAMLRGLLGEFGGILGRARDERSRRRRDTGRRQMEIRDAAAGGDDQRG